MDKCSIPDCNREVDRRTLCSMHYMRWYRGAQIDAPLTRVHVRPVGYRHLRKDGYIQIKVEGSRVYLLEHRVIAEQTLGRPLAADEQVHHLNGDRADNRPENLQVMTNAEHQRLHDHLDVMHPLVTITLVCRLCGMSYEQKPSRATSSKFCSNTCRLIALHEGRKLKK